MAKDEESLAQSREIRQHLKDKYGIIPESIVSADWSIKSTSKAGRTTMQQVKQASKWWDTPFVMSSIHGAHSDFPHNICRFLLRFLAPDAPGTYFSNGLVTVFDPFAGHNSRMEDAFIVGYNYVGWDICHNFMEHNRELAKKLMAEALTPVVPQIELVEGDSRNINYKEQFDVAITSPPFWTQEIYGPEAEQLSNQEQYGDFLDALEKIFSNVWRALKYNSFFACECNDFRKDEKFILFHVGVIERMQWAGFEIHDIIICDYIRSFQSNFAIGIERTKTTGKRHSYFIVGRKRHQYAPRNVGRDEMKEKLLEEIAKIPIEVEWSAKQGVLL